MSNVTIQSNGRNGSNDFNGSNVTYFVITYQLLPCYYIIIYAFRWGNGHMSITICIKHTLVCLNYVYDKKVLCYSTYISYTWSLFRHVYRSLEMYRGVYTFLTAVALYALYCLLTSGHWASKNQHTVAPRKSKQDQGTTTFQYFHGINICHSIITFSSGILISDESNGILS